jgi:Mitochondrial biogenesis AIM24
MNYEILYDQSFALAVVNLKQGERIMAESGAMVSMSPTIQLDAKMSGGGMMGAVKSAMGGESLYRTTFSAESGPGEVTLAPAALGDIVAVELKGEKLFVQPGSFRTSTVPRQTLMALYSHHRGRSRCHGLGNAGSPSGCSRCLPSCSCLFVTGYSTWPADGSCRSLRSPSFVTPVPRRPVSARRPR